MQEIDCTICKRAFDLQGEGGSQGLFGEILVSLCPTCYSCLLDWVSQLTRENNMEDKLVKQLKRIADALEKTNELAKEKQKADINGMLTKSETEWLLAQQDKKKQQ